MNRNVKFLGHPVHQQLIFFPLGLFVTAAAFDLISLTGDARWTQMAFYMIGAGILTGLVAALFGLMDWIQVPDGTRARRIGAFHGVGNLLVVLLFIASFFLRWPNPAAAPMLAYWFSYAAAILVLITGWLGGELVDRLGVGVDPGANVNAPNSLETESEMSHEHRPAA